jgi:tRNA nucleotidyltransferase (CCA-adding enzyme)
MDFREQETLLTLAWQIVDRLEAAGRRAWLVGGCVRDRLSGRPIKDVDIATSALPDEVLAMFERAEPTGLAHGTVTVILRGRPFEVTTLRSESGYSDGRRPDEVRFIDDIREDLARRDFTINAMALAKSGELIDPFGGKRDLESRLLRAVGDPRQRFAEDALRMLRAVRFAAEYGLAVEAGTWDAIVEMAPRIRMIAIERVRMELERITEGSDPAAGYRMLADSGLYRHFKTPLPLDRLTEKAADALGAMAACSDGAVRWVRLFASLGIGPEEAGRLMRGLTFSRRKTDEIAAALAFGTACGTLAGRKDGDASRAFKRLVLRHGKPAAERWLAARNLDPETGGTDLEPARAWLAEMPVADTKELAVGGRDLLAAGLAQGRALGELLGALLERVALGELPNDRERLIGEAKAMVPKGNPDGEPGGGGR